jgi:hypothetical protein
MRTGAPLPRLSTEKVPALSSCAIRNEALESGGGADLINLCDTHPSAIAPSTTAAATVKWNLFLSKKPSRRADNGTSNPRERAPTSAITHVPQRDERIDSGGTARRQVARHQSDATDQERHSDIGQGVRGTNTEQHRRDKACEHQGETSTDDDCRQQHRNGCDAGRTYTTQFGSDPHGLSFRMVVPPSECGDRGNERRGLDRFREVQLESSPECGLPILLARERGERRRGNTASGRRQRAKLAHERIAVLARHGDIGQQHVDVRPLQDLNGLGGR